MYDVRNPKPKITETDTKIKCAKSDIDRCSPRILGFLINTELSKFTFLREHSVSDYKKPIYTKQKIDTLKFKKRRLVNGCKLRNAFVLRLYKSKIKRNKSS